MKKVLVCLVALISLSWTVAAQEKGTSKQDESQSSTTSRSSSAEARPRDTYKLDFTVTELEDGKRLNARTYSLMCENPRTDVGGSRWGAHMRVGSRVPVATTVPAVGGATNGGGGGSTSSPASIQYIDVGMNIDANVDTLEDGALTLYSMVEMSSVAENSSPAGSFTAPVIRQLRASTNSVITPGKPIVLSTADDVGSKRRFEVQVVATKVSGR
jgi:hypothetical protein